MDFEDNFVVNEPLIFFYFVEEGFSVNIFRFGIHSRIFLFCRFVVLKFSRIVFTKFSVLEFFWNC